MRKISPKYENPLDDYTTKIVELINPFFKKLNFTPNALTTISLITGLYSVYFIKNKKFEKAALFYLISYFFDIQDGNYARKYNMVTVFGDYYDHVKDITVIVLVLYYLYPYYKNNKNAIIIFFILAIGMMSQLGCQEIYYNSNDDENESYTLNITRKFCPIKNKKQICKIMHFTKFLGCGTFIAYTTLAIYYLKNYKT